MATRADVKGAADVEPIRPSPTLRPTLRSTFATACAAHFPPRAVAIEGTVGNFPKQLRPGRLCLADGQRVRPGLMVCIGNGTRLGELGIAERLSASVGGCESGDRAFADRLALAFGEGRVLARTK